MGKKCRDKKHAVKVADSERKSCQEEKKKAGGGCSEGGEDFREEAPQNQAADRGRSTEGRPWRPRQRESNREGGIDGIKKEGLIVNGRVVLRNPKMYVGIKARKGLRECVGCVCEPIRLASL